MSSYVVIIWSLMLSGRLVIGMKNRHFLTALEKLEEYVKETPEKTAVIFHPEERFSFLELWEFSGKIYAWLKGKGIGAEDIVLYNLPRGFMLYACMVGTMRAGAAFVLTESGNDPQRTEYIRANSNCRLLVDEECMKEIQKVSPLEGYEPVNRHSLCYIAYTSGTTGHPKGVLHEYGSLDNAWQAVMIDGKAIMYDTDTFLVMSPMNFVAMPICYAYSCAHGCALAVMPYEYAKSDDVFYEYLQRAGVTCGYLTPSILRKHMPFREQWHMCILSSEPADGLFIPGTKCYNTYASTESGCLLSVYELTKPMTPAPVGKSYSEVEVFVADEEGKEVPSGTIGEVCFKNRYVRGYLTDAPDRNGPSRDYVFRTKDAGKKDSDGVLTICGRIDEMFKIGGYRIEPDEVAGAVSRVSNLGHIIVRGFVYKDISAITVFYTDDVMVNPVAMRQKLLKLLPEYMIPTNYIRLKEFPMLSTGKVDKLKLLPLEGNWNQFSDRSDPVMSIISAGRIAEVFDMGKDKVLKLFRPFVTFEFVYREFTQTHAAYMSGLPVADAYGIIRSDDRYGFLLDKESGICLEQMICENPEKRIDLISEFAESVKAIHKIRITDPVLPDVRDLSMYYSEKLSKDYCSESEAKKIRAIFEIIPVAETFAHCDCHTGNAIMTDKELRFIDLSFSGKGHPVFDLLAMFSHYVFLPSFSSEEEYKTRNNMTQTEAETLFDIFLEKYYSKADTAALSRIKSIVRGVHAAQICLASVRIPGVFTEGMLIEARQRTLEFYDQYHIENLNEEILGWSNMV